jgi:hypothetical protein
MDSKLGRIVVLLIAVAFIGVMILPLLMPAS